MVKKKFQILSDVHNIDSIVDRLICNLFEESKLKYQEPIADFIKTSWVNTIIFHDYGKVNESFQSHPEKMNNPNFQKTLTTNSPIGTNHSSLGAYLYIIKHLEDLDKVVQNNVSHENLITVCIVYFSYSIFKHHSKFLNDEVDSKICFSSLEADFMSNYLKQFNFNVSSFSIDAIKHLDNFYLNKDFKKYLNSFSLYNLIRLGFSLLTAADFLASGEFMNGLTIEVEDMGVLTEKRIDEIYNYVTKSEIKRDGTLNYNKNIYLCANEAYLFKNPKEKGNYQLNLLRKEMGIDVLKSIRKHHAEKLFYIESPTGGGKTNLSFLAALELMKMDKKLNKVFYVFPYTTLVTQTQKSLIDTFGLNDSEVITLSSKSGFKETEENSSAKTEDDYYGSKKRYYLDNLFCFFPFCLITHIKFFNILKTNEKEENYLLHRLANSVVVLDEMQAYNPEEWDKIIYFINNYARFYNIRFILMSATLPKLGNLNMFKHYALSFTYLINEAKDRYFHNPNFCERVTFKKDLFDFKNIELTYLADFLITKSIEYSAYDFGEVKPINSVFTIIEFIFKKSAATFYEIVLNKYSFFDEIFVLSGTILEHRRKYIINYIKNKKNRSKKILLITTQVVEAGVDIDMDLGFKDTSLIDSDEQLAGRINRNVNKQMCELYLFNYNRENIIYGRDKRYENIKQLNKDDYFNILQTKNFDFVYNKILEGIERWNTKEGAIGFSDYEENIKKLKFQSVHFKFKLIANEQENISVFIPLNVPVLVEGVIESSYEEVFSKTELEFLSEYGIYPNVENKISGSEVFDLYLSLLVQSTPTGNKKIAHRFMQGIISKFLIQMIGTNKVKTNLTSFQNVEKSDKGYIYLERWNEDGNQLYSEEFGLNDKAFNSVETQFL